MSAPEQRGDCLEFATRGAALVALAESSVESAAAHPLLLDAMRWINESEAMHQVNMQDGTGGGLLEHLRLAWHWATTGAEFGSAYRASRGTPGSSTELGQMVDAEMTALIVGSKLVQPAHAYTVRLLEFLQQRNWVPLATQVPLWHRSNTIYTFVDLMAYDVVGKRLLLLELKTGFDHGYDTPIRNSDISTDDVFVDSLHTRHQQQLCWMHVVLEHELKSSSGGKLASCILRVSEQAGVREPDWSNSELLAFFKYTYIETDAAYTQA